MSESATTQSRPSDAVSSHKLFERLRSLLPLFLVLSLAGLLLIAIATRWNSWVAATSLQSTDDAQIKADVTPLSTQSSGIVERVAVSDYQHVEAGDLLVQLKNDDFRAQVELADAAVAAARAALANLKSQRYLNQSRIAAASASVEATKPDVERTRLDLVRVQSLADSNVFAKQRLEGASADHERFLAQLAGRKAELDAQRKQVNVLDTQQAQLEAELASKRAALKVAQVNLDYTRIVAPAAGIVGERKVRPGQLVSAGTQVLSLVGEDVWVVANYKEAQLARVKVGDAAEITVDGLPDAEWTGRVQNIAPASGAVFSLLPPDNATGNFTKIAQRIPVKIAFAARSLDPRLRAGMSVTAAIRTAP
jgi:membrane fusion protein (multidrug efflux system)